MRDAIELEWAGVPSVAIIAEPLVGSAEAMKRLSGVPDYEYIVVPFPVGGLSREQIEARAKEIAPAVIRLLTAKH
ncbi:MAG: hypothetical protein HY261_00515 [Chloroflexi bacterium]|nr:hypothetical protein [Chloroflexota bacterium]